MGNFTLDRGCFLPKFCTAREKKAKICSDISGFVSKENNILKKGIDFIGKVRYNVLLHKRLSRPKIVEQEV